MAVQNRIDSNSTGLRITEEVIDCIGVLAGTEVWDPYDPNSYADFGGNVTTVSRRPIEPGRQRRKGTAVSIEAGGGFNIDLTQNNMTELLQGLMFASIEETDVNTNPITDITTGVLTATVLDTDFPVGTLLFGTGGLVSDQNQFFEVTAAGAGTITVTPAPADDASPDAGWQLQEVGFSFLIGDLDVLDSGALPALTSTSKSFLDLKIQPGEWIFVGGDTSGAAGNQFLTAANNGFARVRTVEANSLSVDLTDSTWVTEANTAEFIHIFYGRVLHNQALAADQQRRTYQLERTLGEDANGTQSEYLEGQIFGEGTFNFPLEDKVNLDAVFTGLDHSTRDGTTGVKAGSHAGNLVSAEPYNTATDIEYRLAVFTEGTTAPTPLATYIEELTLSVNNNVSPVKALGTLGAIDVTAGGFDVSGSITAIFDDIDAIATVRAVSDVTLNWRLVRENAGIHFDLPLLTLGEARATVEQDAAVKLPISADAATGASIDATALDHTLMLTFFPYLPTLAE